MRSWLNKPQFKSKQKNEQILHRTLSINWLNYHHYRPYFCHIYRHRPAFAQYGQLSPDAQLAYDEEMARIEWIKRNGDIPPPPTQADLEYMQRYTEQLQAQYDKEKK